MRFMYGALGMALAVGIAAGAAADDEANAIVQRCLDHSRGDASRATATMIVHRPDWERSMTMEVWTRGETESLVRITDPPKDKGNGTLKRDEDMWMFNPKVNRVIKLPPSMMSQGWMGSDFSNDDLSRTDSLVKDYDHTIEATSTVDGATVYDIKSIPRRGAPVVWGKMMLRIREDGVLLVQEFFDDDMEPVKKLTTSDIRRYGDRYMPAVWTIRKSDVEGEYTEFRYDKLEFLKSLPEDLFTQTNLRNPSR